MPVGISAYIPLANLTLGANAATVTISGISTSYRDLILTVNPKSTSSAELFCRINSDAASNYGCVVMRGDGSGPTADNGTFNRIYIGTMNLSTTEYSQFTYQFFDYNQTDRAKIVLTRADRSDAQTIAVATRWANNNAISTITFSMSAGSLAAGSSFALYGIAA